VFSASNVLGGHSGHADYYKRGRGRDFDVEIRRWIERGEVISSVFFPNCFFDARPARVDARFTCLLPSIASPASPNNKIGRIGKREVL
jgi:hypothetical protein